VLLLATFSFQVQPNAAFDGSRETDEVSPQRWVPKFESKFPVNSAGLVNGLMALGSVPAASPGSLVAMNWRTNVCPHELPCGSVEVQLSQTCLSLLAVSEALKSSEQLSANLLPCWMVAWVEVSEVGGGRAALEALRRTTASDLGRNTVRRLPAFGEGAFVARRVLAYARGRALVELQTGYSADGRLQLTLGQLARLAEIVG
jgi:hypothetical protein